MNFLKFSWFVRVDILLCEGIYVKAAISLATSIPIHPTSPHSPSLDLGTWEEATFQGWLV